MSNKNISFSAQVVSMFGAIFMVGCAQNYPTHIVYSDTADGAGVSTGINSYQYNINHRLPIERKAEP